MPPAAENVKAHASQGGIVRGVLEFCVALALAVTLFRTFVAEGYVIETGSMAPSLLGLHRRATCPACRSSFAVEGSQTSIRAVCPNCDRADVSLEGVVRNDGDQLLVCRSAFEYRRPRRWEVVVFRNPARPVQAFVKRIVGLPGETLEIIDGDVYIAGQIQAKGLSTQRGIRIPVYDNDHRPPDDDPDWMPRWVAEGEESGWQPRGGNFVIDSRTSSTPDERAWVRYRHWIRGGGSHATSVQLPFWPSSRTPPTSPYGPLRYEAANQMLICRGAMRSDARKDLVSADSSAEFQQAIRQLYEGSHIAPIRDEYGYNYGREASGNQEVRDLMLCLMLAFTAREGEFVLSLYDGNATFECQFDAAERKVRLVHVETETIVRTGEFPERAFGPGTQIEFSLMDRQALLAIDGELAFEPWSYPAPEQRGPTPWNAVRFGGRRLAAEVSRIQLYRDVYYTPGEGRRGTGSAISLPAGEYFALGDNSPVSRDSRSWPEGKVLRSSMFLGKPFLVHLPSYKSRVRLGKWQTDVRIPEVSRIRYIR